MKEVKMSIQEELQKNLINKETDLSGKETQQIFGYKQSKTQHCKAWQTNGIEMFYFLSQDFELTPSKALFTSRDGERKKSPSAHYVENPLTEQLHKL